MNRKIVMSLRTFCGIVIGTLVLWSIALPQGGGVPRRQPARGVAATHTPQPQETPDDGTRKVVDFRADLMRPIKIGDSSVMNLVGNVVFYHNGAIITCDSAIRFNDRRMECFGRVVINKDSLYIYGDRADYNGELNLAHVYAPIIKMTDGDATLYTYRFRFNTLDNIGRYDGGGTMTQGDNLLESKRGYYYADLHEMIAVEEVELRNPDYRIRSDSAGYNTETEIATFFRKTYIWNEKDEILSAERGYISQRDSFYRFTSNAYILTDIREVWADSIYYNTATDEAILRRDIQIRDEDQGVIAFGDYGEYWGGPENAMLTRNPSIVSFDPKEDTLYMRSDSMFLFTVPYGTGRPAPEAEKAGTADEEELIVPSHPVVAAKEQALDSLRTLAAEHAALDSLHTVADTLPGGVVSGDSVVVAAPDSVPVVRDPKQIRAEAKKQAAEAKKRKKEAKRLQKEIRRAEKDVAYAKKQAAKEAARREKEARKHGHDHADHDHDTLTLGSMSERLEAMIRRAASATGDDSVRLFAEAWEQLKKLESMQAEAAQAVASALPDSVVGAILTPDTLGASDSLPARGRIELERYRAVLASGDTTLLSGPWPPLDSAALAGGIIPDSLQAALLPADNAAQDSLERVIRGYHNVRIFRTDFQAVCDSLVGFSIDSTFHLYIDPVLWNGENQITSQLMDIYTKNQQIDRAVFIGEPLMVSKVDSVHFNQIKGKVMEALFRDNDIYRVDVNGNGQTLYYMVEDDNPEEIIGFLVAECADITFMIRERQIETITWRGNPVYSIFPMDKIPPEQPQFLPGFQWLPERKPALEDVFYGRTIRPSEREAYEAIPEPVFPLTDAITKDRERMIREGIWVERNDQISSDVRDFVRSLGY